MDHFYYRLGMWSFLFDLHDSMGYSNGIEVSELRDSVYSRLTVTGSWHGISLELTVVKVPSYSPRSTQSSKMIPRNEH